MYRDLHMFTSEHAKPIQVLSTTMVTIGNWKSGSNQTPKHFLAMKTKSFPDSVVSCCSCICSYVWWKEMANSNKNNNNIKITVLKFTKFN